MTALLSNPVLDELYSIRRVFVGRYVSVSKIKDGPGMEYYLRKVDALDDAIASFIEVNKVPVEHVEQSIQERARQSLGMVRVPGSEQT